MKLRQVLIMLGALLIIALGLLASAFLGSQKDEPKQAIAEVPIKYVRIKPIKYSSLSTSTEVFGRVRASETLDLIPEVPGRMSRGSIPLKEGQRFKAGQLICLIDDTEPRLNLQAQKSNFLRDLAAILPDLKIDYSGNFKTWQDYFNSIDLEKDLPKLPAYKNDKEKTFLATKNVFSSYYLIKSSEVNLRKHRIYAPFDGSISEVYLQSGSYVNPGTKVATILSSNRLELQVSVETKDISWIRLGQEVDISTEDQLASWKGKIIRIGDFVNPNTQSVDVYISIYKGKNKVLDGLYLKAVIPGGKIDEAMVIPRNAVFGGNNVFVLEDTVLKVREIIIHRISPEEVIFSGIEENKEIVIEPLVSAYNNMRAAKIEQ